jgi:flavin reductase (DIM6/NTAB) family NADH-FMN oxidoreductase RutF
VTPSTHASWSDKLDALKPDRPRHDKATEVPLPAGGVEADRLRAAIGQFVTGVTVITSRDRSGRPYGTTANAVSSVSLEPPLVLACLRRESETLAAPPGEPAVCHQVLHSSQAELSERFAHRAAADTWEAVAHRSANDIPVLDDTIVMLQCDLHDVADGGDRVVVVGHVVELDHPPDDDADPLLFYAGSYRRVGGPARTPPEPTEVALPARDGPLRMLNLSDAEEATSVAVLTGDPRGRHARGAPHLRPRRRPPRSARRGADRRAHRPLRTERSPLTCPSPCTGSCPPTETRVRI